MINPIEIADFYDQRSILITGSTGFLGKVLVEKLLRSLPNIKRLYLLIRPQANIPAKQRLEALLQSQLFSIVKQKSPQVFEKLTAIDGDLTDENLGLSETNAQTLLDEVSIVFHCAATVKFDEALRISVAMNVCGTQRLLQFCRRMKNIAVFAHASTAYANCDRSHILESVYTPPMEPQKLVDALAWMDDEMVSSLTPLLVGQRPNTYTFTKALAEYVVSEQSRYIPVTIVRPSIIGAIWREPLPGWTDNLNGPTGLFASIGKGLLRSMIGTEKATADIIPVDVVSNVLIVAAWHRANESSECCPVINCCTSKLNTLMWGDVVQAMKFFNQYPLEDVFRVPRPRFTMNKFWRESMIFLDHLVPAYLIDMGCKLLGHKPKLIRTYRKLFKAVDMLEYFTARGWHFQSQMILNLLSDLSPKDKQTFDIDVTHINWHEYLEAYIIGVKKYILKEQMCNVTKARRQLQTKKFVTLCLDMLIGYVACKFFVKRYPALFNRLWFYLLTIFVALNRMRPPTPPKIVLNISHNNNNKNNNNNYEKSIINSTTGATTASNKQISMMSTLVRMLGFVAAEV